MHVNRYYKFFFFSLILQMLSTSVFAQKIGILGCIHGDVQILKKVLTQMKSEGVGYLIGTGDFVSSKDSLDDVLKILSVDSGLSRDAIYLMPGNWENGFNTKRSVESNLKIFHKYGRLISEDYSKSGLIEIYGKKIQVSHFPQYTIPMHLLPPLQFLYRFFPDEAHIIQTMTYQSEIAQDIDLSLYGHTHIRGYFYDQKNLILTVNSGGLTDKKKPDEKKSFAIYDVDQAQIEFYDAEADGLTLIEIVPLQRPHLSEKKDVFEVGNFEICDLEQQELRGMSELFQGLEGIFEKMISASCLMSPLEKLSKLMESLPVHKVTPLEKKYIQKVNSILEQDSDLIPEIIYHHGSHEYMKKYIENKQISLEDWDQWMSTSRMENYRKGLYGTFSKRFIPESNSVCPETIEVHLKKECRHPSRVSTVAQLGRDKRFIEWAKLENILKQEKNEKINNIQDYFDQCFATDKNIEKNINEFNYYTLASVAGSLKAFESFEGFQAKYEPEARGFCGEVIHQYLNEQKIAIVLDDAYQRYDHAVYVRDPSCIEDIQVALPTQLGESYLCLEVGCTLRPFATYSIRMK